MITSYLNSTNYPVKLKKLNGEVINAESGQWQETTKENPFIKINYLIMGGWKKLN